MSVQSTPLKGKVAIVTGSGRGIGAAEVLRLAALGADVAVNYAHSANAAEGVAQQARAFGIKAITIKADVSKREDITALFDKTKAEYGRIDIVMSNSGIEHFGNLPDVTEEQIDKVMAINVKGQFFVAQEAYKHLEDYGRLILISSVSAVWVSPIFKRCPTFAYQIRVGCSSPCSLCHVQGSHHGDGQVSGLRLWPAQYHRELYCARWCED